MEHNDRTMLLVAEPGMGKSTFLSHMEHIKKWNPSVWVQKINLHEHTSALENTEFERGNTDKCTDFLLNAANLSEQNTLPLERKIFSQALEHSGKMVIILDGFDEISPDYSPKVNMILRTIIDKTASKIWVSSRLSCRQELEDILVKLAFTLQPFTEENQIQFLEGYWNGIIKTDKEGNLRIFATELLSLCSKNFIEKDRVFTGIPLQTMMLGEAFMKQAEEYCSTGKFQLPKKFNLLNLFKKFTERKIDIYFNAKREMDTSKPAAKREEKSYLDKHMVPALMTLFSKNEVSLLLQVTNNRHFEQAKEFLSDGSAQEVGIITHVTDEKPYFIHRCFAEYFAAKWFTLYFEKCDDFIKDTLFISTYEVTRNIFDRILAEDFKIHCAVLNEDALAVEELLTMNADINRLDKGGRTALHLAASYNSTITQKLLSAPGVDANKQDTVLK
jgi:hypothetical protein